MIARGSGGRVLPGRDTVEIVISAHFWLETVANLRHNGSLVATFVDPVSYRAFRLKGLATVRPAEAKDRLRVEGSVVRDEQLLVDLGLHDPPSTIG